MSQVLKPINKPLTETRILWHPEYLKLAEQIRGLKSKQILSKMTDGEGHRCVMGALMVEVHGTPDNTPDIYHNLNTNNDLDILFINRLWTTLADMNNSGFTFNQIADEMEARAYEEDRRY